MAFSRITITFNADLVLNDRVSFRRKYDNGTISGDWSLVTEQWKNQRIAPGQVTIGTPTGTPGERSAINYVQALILDVLFMQSADASAVPWFGVERIGNVVRITQDPYWQFDLNSLPAPNPGDVDIVITNYGNALFFVSDYEFSEATTNPKCTHVKLSVTTSVLATSYTLPNGVEVTGNTDNPIVVEVPRQIGVIMSLTNADDQTIFLGLVQSQMPPLFSEASINPQVTNTPTGGTMVVLVISTALNSFEYSLNGTDWQASNTFTNLAPDTYTLYVRDAWGCVRTQEVIITSIGSVSKPVHHFSESLPIRMCERATPASCGGALTERQRLSHEEKAEDMTLVYRYKHPVLSCEVRDMQFNCNFETITAVVVNPDGSEDAILVYKKTNNIGLKDRRDALKYSLGNGQTGIYFLSGNIYDYDTQVDTGNDYLLNGGLPEWAKINNYIDVGGAWFNIVNIIYDEALDAEVIVIDSNNSTSTPTAVVVASVYNRQEYEVYEFAFTALPYLDSEVRLKVTLEDPNFTTVEYLSELIDVRAEHPGTVGIRYWNNKNTDLFYATGIQLQTRVALLREEPGEDSDQEVLKTDLSASLLSANLYDLITYHFDSVPKGIKRMLSRALTHQNVYMDDEHLVKNSSFESELQGKTNLALFKAPMMKTGNVYTTELVGGTPVIVDTIEVLEVPNLMAPEDDAFIGY